MIGENLLENVNIREFVIAIPNGQATSDVDSHESENITVGEFSEQLRNKEFLVAKSGNISSVLENAYEYESLAELGESVKKQFDCGKKIDKEAYDEEVDEVINEELTEKRTTK
ncbi:hypothetical protein M0802_014648 [Mischocyttarus mexicanus]|nr:hypothetical protein M0802_014648 [Mischocyttarus mexicanus]